MNILIQLLEDNQISDQKKESICYCIAEWLHQIDSSTSSSSTDKDSSKVAEQKQFSNLLKIKFQELGLLHILINIIKKKRTEESQSLVYASLVAICELCFACENKRVIDQLGYMSLSSLVKNTSVQIDDYLYQLLVELTMNKPVKHHDISSYNTSVYQQQQQQHQQ
ncbi:hypothetical protein ACTFIY_002762 [Dictyostelium cf. discoideum]